jgi:hypothetical protein
MNTFSSDAEFGHRIQAKVLERLPVMLSRSMKGYFPAFDVAVVQDNQIQYLEFKSDRIGWATGNLAIEFLHNGKDSGIRTSHADRWIYTLVSPSEEFLEVYDIPVSVLKEMVGRLEYETIKTTGNELTAFYIFQKDTFQEFRLPLEPLV